MIISLLLFKHGPNCASHLCWASLSQALNESLPSNAFSHIFFESIRWPPVILLIVSCVYVGITKTNNVHKYHVLLDLNTFHMGNPPRHWSLLKGFWFIHNIPNLSSRHEFLWKVSFTATICVRLFELPKRLVFLSAPLMELPAPLILWKQKYRNVYEVWKLKHCMELQRHSKYTREKMLVDYRFPQHRCMRPCMRTESHFSLASSPHRGSLYCNSLLHSSGELR